MKSKFEAWNWNLKLEFEKLTWNWNLKLKLEIETWNLKLKLEIETWIWTLKLKLKIETRNWNLKFNLEIETWNWTWNWTHSPSLWFDLESGLFNLYFCLDFSYIQDELTIQTTLLLLLPHERLRIQERWDQLHSHFEISMFRSFLSDFNPLPPLKIDFCYIIGIYTEYICWILLSNCKKLIVHRHLT